MEEGIVKKGEATKIIRAIRKINVEEVEQAHYDSRFEDLFFQIEHDQKKIYVFHLLGDGGDLSL